MPNATYVISASMDPAGVVKAFDSIAQAVKRTDDMLGQFQTKLQSTYNLRIKVDVEGGKLADLTSLMRAQTRTINLKLRLDAESQKIVSLLGGTHTGAASGRPQSTPASDTPAGRRAGRLGAQAEAIDAGGPVTPRRRPVRIAAGAEADLAARRQMGLPDVPEVMGRIGDDDLREIVAEGHMGAAARQARARNRVRVQTQRLSSREQLARARAEARRPHDELSALIDQASTLGPVGRMMNDPEADEIMRGIMRAPAVRAATGGAGGRGGRGATGRGPWWGQYFGSRGGFTAAHLGMPFGGYFGVAGAANAIVGGLAIREGIVGPMLTSDLYRRNEMATVSALQMRGVPNAGVAGAAMSASTREMALRYAGLASRESVMDDAVRMTRFGLTQEQQRQVFGGAAGIIGGRAQGAGAAGFQGLTGAISRMVSERRVDASELQGLSQMGVPVYEILAQAESKRRGREVSPREIEAMARDNRLAPNKTANDLIRAGLELNKTFEDFRQSSVPLLGAAIKEAFDQKIVTEFGEGLRQSLIGPMRSLYNITANGNFGALAGPGGRGLGMGVSLPFRIFNAAARVANVAAGVPVIGPTLAEVGSFALPVAGYAVAARLGMRRFAPGMLRGIEGALQGAPRQLRNRALTGLYEGAGWLGAAAAHYGARTLAPFGTMLSPFMGQASRTIAAGLPTEFDDIARLGFRNMGELTSAVGAGWPGVARTIPATGIRGAIERVGLSGLLKAGARKAPLIGGGIEFGLNLMGGDDLLMAGGKAAGAVVGGIAGAAGGSALALGPGTLVGGIAGQQAGSSFVESFIRYTRGEKDTFFEAMMSWLDTVNPMSIGRRLGQRVAQAIFDGITGKKSGGGGGGGGSGSTGGGGASGGASGGISGGPPASPIQAGPGVGMTANGFTVPQDEGGKRVLAQRLKDSGFSDTEIYNMCGPLAASAIAGYNGIQADPVQLMQNAIGRGEYKAGKGGGVLSAGTAVPNMLRDVGLEPISLEKAQALQAMQNGKAIGINTAGHYYVGRGYDPTTGLIDTGNTGAAFKGGTRFMTMDDIVARGGGLAGGPKGEFNFIGANRPQRGGGAGGTQIDSSSRESFVRSIMPVAKSYEQQTGIPAAAYIAMAASESNWGKAPGNMLFGIKGPGATMQTWESVNGQRVGGAASFRTYPDAESAFQDFTSLTSQGRYSGAWQQFQRDKDWKGYIANLNKAGYATDPKWASNVASLAEGSVSQLMGGAGAGGLTIGSITVQVQPGDTEEHARAQSQLIVEGVAAELASRMRMLRKNMAMPGPDTAVP